MPASASSRPACLPDGSPGLSLAGDNERAFTSLGTESPPDFGAVGVGRLNEVLQLVLSPPRSRSFSVPLLLWLTLPLEFMLIFRNGTSGCWNTVTCFLLSSSSLFCCSSLAFILSLEKSLFTLFSLAMGPISETERFKDQRIGRLGVKRTFALPYGLGVFTQPPLAHTHFNFVPLLPICAPSNSTTRVHLFPCLYGSKTGCLSYSLHTSMCCNVSGKSNLI